MVLKNLHNQRKLNRLKKYDYSLEGYYFITLCTKNRINYFGKIIAGKMYLNEYGKIILKHIQNFATNNPGFYLDTSAIMPNHVHLIVVIRGVGVGTGLCPVPGSISDALRNLKAFSSREINKTNPNILFFWQRSFYDRIIRNETELKIIQQYILDNPKNWDSDSNNLEIDSDKS